MRFQRYAVMGSNSFAGAAFIARAIADGADVIGFNRSPETSSIFHQYPKVEGSGRYRFFQADINHNLDTILTRLDEFNTQVIVDFAGQGMVAESWKNPEQWYTTNIVAKVRFHDQLRRRTWLQRYIRISTPEVYGSQDTLVSENFQYNPSTPYAVSHAAIDMSLRAFHQQYDFPVIFSRFANFYGPGQQLYRIVPRTIIYALSGKKLQLHGGGTSIRAFIYGADVADGIMRTIDKGTVGEVYHFSPERFLTIRQLVEITCQQMGVDFDNLVELTPDRPGKDLAYLMNSNKVRTELDWLESVSFEQGINATVEWVKASFDEIRTLPLDYLHKI